MTGKKERRVWPDDSQTLKKVMEHWTGKIVTKHWHDPITGEEINEPVELPFNVEAFCREMDSLIIPPGSVVISRDQLREIFKTNPFLIGSQKEFWKMAQIVLEREIFGDEK